MKAHLFFQQGPSDKEYVLELSGSGDYWKVNALYGRRGSVLRPTPKTKIAVSYSAAANVYNEVLQEKVSGGYRGEGDNIFAPLDGPEPSIGRAQSKPTIAHAPAIKQHAGEQPCELLTSIEPAQAERFIKSDRYAMQLKEDGHRRSIRKNGKIEGIKRNGDFVPLSPELVQEFSELPAHEFFVDGEIVGEGVILWDLLSLNGRDLRDRPYSERLQKLQTLIEGEAHISVIQTWIGTEAKTRAIIAVHDAKQEGVVFKDLDAPFAPGRAAQHFKLKFLKSCTVRVVAKTKRKESRSIGIELFDGANWIEMGHVTLPSASTLVPPVGALVEVEYLWVLKGGHLYQSKFKEVRDDVDESAATLSQLVYKDDRKAVEMEG